MTHEDIAEVWLCALAFHRGYAVKSDRAPEVIARTDRALTEVRKAFNLVIDADRIEATNG